MYSDKALNHRNEMASSACDLDSAVKKKSGLLLTYTQLLGGSLKLRFGLKVSIDPSNSST